jgi:hypothetical protein
LNIQQLQINLQTSGRYFGMLDGVYGPLTGAAVLQALTDGPDTRLTDHDYEAAADSLGLQPAYVKAFAKVESAGDGFVEGRPVLLFEPHRFSRATKGIFDQRCPTVSYPRWDKSRYPRQQEARYGQLIKAVGLNVDAGFASASYGKFQVLGENFKVCGYPNSYSFAVAQAYDEATQLKAFLNFVKAKGIHDDLRRGDFETAATKYNGTAAYLNDYAGKIRRAVLAFGGRI